jgi:ribose transport system permease protein
MTLVIATGGIDLSVGSLMAIAVALSPLFFTGELFQAPLYVGIALGIVIPIMIAGVFGLFNGWLITKFSIQPIIATLVVAASRRSRPMATYRCSRFPNSRPLLLVASWAFLSRSG